MPYSLTNPEWQNINQTIYRINKEDDYSSFMFHVMKHLNLLCPYTCGIFNLIELIGSGIKICKTLGVNLLPEDTDAINKYCLAQSPFIRGRCMSPGGSVACGFSRDQFTESQQMNFRSTIIPRNPDNTIIIVIYFENELLGFILLMRRDSEESFSEGNICAMDVIRHHISLQLSKLLRSSKNIDIEVGKKLNFENVLRNYDLTKKEVEILNLMLEHVSDEKICEELFITSSTFKKHLSHIYKKMFVKTRIELIQAINSKK